MESVVEHLLLHWWLRARRIWPRVHWRRGHWLYVWVVYWNLDIVRVWGEMTMLTGVWLGIRVVVEEGRLSHRLSVLI